MRRNPELSNKSVWDFFMFTLQEPKILRGSVLRKNVVQLTRVGDPQIVRIGLKTLTSLWVIRCSGLFVKQLGSWKTWGERRELEV